MVAAKHGAGTQRDTGDKGPFDIGLAVERLREAVRPYPKAALFELAEQGYATVFQQLVACIISIRTRDEVTLPVACRLFEQAADPGGVARMTPEAIAQLIRPATFYEGKARQIHAIAARAVTEHSGALPCDDEALLSFNGVGPKCANLVLGIACHEPRIAVDVHVHRVANRWGYIQTKSELESVAALEKLLPKAYRIELNSLLVPFGKHICTGQLPHCSTCPLLDMCRQVGVTTHR